MTSQGTFLLALTAFVLPLWSAAQITNGSARTAGTDINSAIVEFTNGKMGKKVGHGECWDLAAEALIAAGATWDGKYTWGLVIDPMKDAVLPGDVVQFENVVFEWETDNSLYRENMPHHTAIIIEVKSPGVFLIAHQNFGEHGRKVGASDLVLAHKKKGNLTVYRPQR